MTYVERMIVPVVAQQTTGGGTFYPVITVAGSVYQFYVDASSDLAYVKSADSGKSWSAPVTVRTGTLTQFAVWYDRWSNISAGLIHLAYSDSATNLVYYRNLDTESSDTLGSEITAHTGTSIVATNGAISITRARGGNLYIGAMIDAGTENVFVRSVDVGANWTGRNDTTGTTLNEASATDQLILVPGWNADNQDIMAFFWDASADEISVKRYDDSADTWAETSIAASMTDTTRPTSGPHWGATVDITNSQNLLVAWSQVDNAAGDLRCFKVTDGAVTETATQVAVNPGAEFGAASIGIDTLSQTWYVMYQGGGTWFSSCHVYYKASTDGGATWGSQTQLSSVLGQRQWAVIAPRFAGTFFTANQVIIGALNTLNTFYDYPSAGMVSG
jgi:hypothetical protein